MTSVTFGFIPAGSVVKPEKSIIYVDVGNSFEEGILDHHHSNPVHGKPFTQSSTLITLFI